MLTPHLARAHPRSRGENDEIFRNTYGGRGSSPLTRGKPVDAKDREGVPRLIPAHAGKTRRSRGVRSVDAAHPRSRGENVFQVRDGHAYRGSSPLTRGKHGAVTVRLNLTGLIPAHAGKTRLATKRDRSSTAHPRSRGENAARGTREAGSGGSSPLTRGKLSR